MALHALSVNDGSLTSFAGRARAGRRWREAEFERLLALNPELLGVTGELPLCLGGGSTRTSPDLSFVDDLGRVTVVELKNEVATPDALMQLLSYGELWRGLPTGEASSSVRWLTAEGAAARELGRASLELEAWLNESPATGDERAWARRGTSVLARGVFGWANRGYRSVEDHGQQLSEKGLWRSWPAPPIRAVLIAPGFSPECLALARTLIERQISLELIEAKLLVTDEARPRIAVRWEPALSDPDHQPLWRAVRTLWRSAFLREHFGPNGWADHLSRASFSLSSLHSPAVKLWVEMEGDTVLLSTALPDRWSEGSERARWRRTLLSKLPPPDKGDRWVYWAHRAGEPDESLKERAEQLAQAPHQVLVPLDRDWG